MIKQGIDREIAKRIVKEVKDGKLKVQVRSRAMSFE